MSHYQGVVVDLGTTSELIVAGTVHETANTAIEHYTGVEVFYNRIFVEE